MRAAVDMVEIAAGQVQLTDRRTERCWSVEFDSFQLSTVPITRAQYADITGRPAGNATDDQLPIESVSWDDAVHFCNRLSERTGRTPAYCISTEDHAIEQVVAADGYRLPTEAEWEYACRAGTTGPRYGQLDDIAWYRANSDARMREVGGKQPNAFGLYDMLGNVWEWCWDQYDPQVYGDYRVLRGGGWFDEQWSCRASVRRRSHPTLRLDDVGFRIARSHTH